MTDLISRARFGARVGSEPYPDSPSEDPGLAHFALEATVGARLPIASWFIAWPNPWRADAAAVLSAHGAYDVMLAWEAHDVPHEDIIAGQYDPYIAAFVSAASRHEGGQVVVRPFHEFNGNWYDWSPASLSRNCTQVGQWIRAWRHIVRVGRAVGARNVRFLWCPNGTDVGGIPMEDFYPGDDFVDLVGHDAYSLAAEGNPSFHAVHKRAYDRITALNQTADYWIAETGTDSQVPSFYAGAYACQQFPRITAVAWFSTRQWRIDSDPGCIAVHRDYLGRMPSAHRFRGAGDASVE